MTFQKTSQERVFRCVETGEYFEHDGRSPISQELGMLQQIGIDPIPFVAPSYTEQRRNAYLAEIKLSDFMEAIFEQAEGRPEKMEALRARRQAIKDRIPKP